MRRARESVDRGNRPLLLAGLLGAVLLVLGAVVVVAIMGHHSYPPVPDRPPEIPRKATPLAVLNTEWDDYNMQAPPYRPRRIRFVWSTNRGSKGEQFDIWTATGFFHVDGRLSIEQDPLVVAEISSRCNEYGPVRLDADYVGEYIFASDREGGRGGLDIWFQDQRGAIVLFGLNSSANDAYFTWNGLSEGYFASDRGGAGWDIHRVMKPGSVLTGRGLLIENGMKVERLSSPSDDTAPCLFDQEGAHVSQRSRYILFASNRPGGHGGWDLWCSRKDEFGEWEPPRNLGPTVNTPADEFRPSVTAIGEYYGSKAPPGEVSALFFSSNRPGGKGGYDLYYMVFPDPFASTGQPQGDQRSE